MEVRGETRAGGQTPRNINIATLSATSPATLVSQSVVRATIVSSLEMAGQDTEAGRRGRTQRQHAETGRRW